MKSYLISESDLQSMLNYLASRPYNEVFKLVEIIRAAPEGMPRVTVEAPKKMDSLVKEVKEPIAKKKLASVPVTPKADSSN